MSADKDVSGTSHPLHDKYMDGNTFRRQSCKIFPLINTLHAYWSALLSRQFWKYTPTGLLSTDASGIEKMEDARDNDYDNKREFIYVLTEPSKSGKSTR